VLFDDPFLCRVRHLIFSYEACLKTAFTEQDNDKSSSSCVFPWNQPSGKDILNYVGVLHTGDINDIFPFARS
jgi:hypothetical protein